MGLSQIRTFNVRVNPNVQAIDATATEDRIYILGVRSTDGNYCRVYVTDWDGTQQSTEELVLPSVGYGNGGVGEASAIAYINNTLCVLRERAEANPYATLQYIRINPDRTLTAGAIVPLIPDVPIDIESMEIVGGSLFIMEGTGEPLNMVRYDFPDLYRIETRYFLNTTSYEGGFTHGGPDEFWIALNYTGMYPQDATLWRYGFGGLHALDDPQLIGAKLVQSIAVGGTGQVAVCENLNGQDIPVTVYGPVESYLRSREPRLIMVPGEQVSKVFKPRSEFGIHISKSGTGGTSPTVTVEISPDGVHWYDEDTTLSGNDYKNFRIASGFYCRVSVANVTNAIYSVYIGYVDDRGTDIANDIIVR